MGEQTAAHDLADDMFRQIEKIFVDSGVLLPWCRLSERRRARAGCFEHRCRSAGTSSKASFGIGLAVTSQGRHFSIGEPSAGETRLWSPPGERVFEAQASGTATFHVSRAAEPTSRRGLPAAVRTGDAAPLAGVDSQRQLSLPKNPLAAAAGTRRQRRPQRWTPARRAAKIKHEDVSKRRSCDDFHGRLGDFHRHFDSNNEQGVRCPISTARLKEPSVASCR